MAWWFAWAANHNFAQAMVADTGVTVTDSLALVAVFLIAAFCSCSFG
jgi:hypothetical protein